MPTSKPAGQIPQTWISDAATITATGRITAIYGLRDTVTVTLVMPASALVERVKAD